MQVSDSEYNLMVSEVTAHYRRMWVLDGGKKIKAKSRQLTHYKSRIRKVKEKVEQLMRGEFDDKLDKPSAKEATLERYIDQLTNYNGCVNRLTREIKMLREIKEKLAAKEQINSKKVVNNLEI